MPKVLITESCLINRGDDRGGVHCEVGEIAENVPKDIAVDLARMGRVLFVDSTDDPTKGNTLTASKEMLKAAADMRSARAKAAKESQAPAADAAQGGNNESGQA